MQSTISEGIVVPYICHPNPELQLQRLWEFVLLQLKFLSLNPVKSKLPQEQKLCEGRDFVLCPPCLKRCLEQGFVKY